MSATLIPTDTVPAKKGWLHTVKHQLAVSIEFLRRPGRFCIYNYARPEALARLKSAGRKKVLDIGCGTRRLGSEVIAVDLTASDYVHVVANAEHLPFGDNQCEGVWLEAVLEHVPDPQKILEEIKRVLKPSGWLYIEVPFLQGEHAAPGDYQRWTKGGLLKLFRSWKVDWITDSSGPFSALAYQLRTCLSLVTSFGSDRLYRILFEALWGYVVWPIKFLDVPFKAHPYSSAHAFGYAIMLTKEGL